MPGGGVLEYRRLRAPAEDGGVLVEPAPDAALVKLAQAHANHPAGHLDLQGRSGADLSAAARRELIQEAANYSGRYLDCPLRDELDIESAAQLPLVLTGHQPILFHPGVWLKNLLLDRLARESGGLGVHLLIDNDTHRTSAARVLSGTVEQPHVETVPFDKPGPPVPHEERELLDRELFSSFADRACTAIAPLVPAPLLIDYWPQVMAAAEQMSNLGGILAAGRHRLECSRGSRTLELPLSRLCDGPSFRWFAAVLLADLPRLREAYNDCLDEYRRLHGVRSAAHPVPDLRAQDDWLEAPLWIWSRGDPRRRPLFARRQGEQLVLTDRGDLRFGLRLSKDRDPADAVAELADVRQRGIKLRPRALITTMYARLILCDQFIHGIGGAKYDQLTDAIAARLFEVEPPPFVTATCTLRLPIERPTVSESDLTEIDQHLRELTYHPEKHIDPPALDDQDQRYAESLIEEKHQWIRTQPPRGERKGRHDAITRVNEALQPYVQSLRAHLQRRRAEVEDALRRDAILSSREYAFCLHPRKEMQRRLCRLLDADGADL